MKNILKGFCVLMMCVSLFSCGEESIITDTTKDDTRVREISSEINIKETAGFHNPITQKKRDLINVDEIKVEDNVIETPVVPEPEKIDQVDNEVIDIEIEEVEINKPREFSSENMVIIDSLSLYIDKYELSIGEYCEVFPDMFDELVERIENSNDHWRSNLHPNENYPAILFHEEAVEYGEIMGKRLPTWKEWLHVAKGNGSIGVSNMNHSRVLCINAEKQIFHVVNDQQHPNGYGVYEMMGNVTEHCIYIDKHGKRYATAAGLYWKSCAGMIRNWFPLYANIRREGVRYVADIK